MQGKITKRAVDAMKPGETIWDAELKGFGCRSQKSSRRIYVYKFKQAGRQRWITIGPHGSPWTPESARREALQLAGAVASGESPADEREAERKAIIVDELAKRFLAEHTEVKSRATTQDGYARIIEKFITPALGKLRVSEVTRADIAKLHHDLRSTPYQANRVLAVVSKMLNWAERVGLRTEGPNPCRYVEKFREQARQRFLSEAELAKLGDALTGAEAEWHAHQAAVAAAKAAGTKQPQTPKGLVSPPAIAAIRLLVLTGARLSEVLTLRWAEVDLERGMLLLSDSKTGAKPIYLNPPARELLEGLPRIGGCAYVIPGEKPGAHLVNLQKPWRSVRGRAGLDDVRLHDLRHSYASIAAGLGQSLVVIGKMLGHTQAQTTARYAHLATDPVRQAADAVGARIANAMAGKKGGEGGEGGNVVPLR